jgi:peptidoglycan-associated lipoprotein
MKWSWLQLSVLLTVTLLAACGGKKPPVANAPAPTPTFPGAITGSSTDTASRRPPDPPPVPGDSAVTSTPIDPLAGASTEVLNGPNSPLKPVLFELDSDTLDDAAKKVLDANAGVLRQYKTWIITVEGHCDERGSAEYNLALGDRRALAARTYLISLGIPADRLRTISYGKEFPFDAAHTESAYKTNRRAHFMVTAK